MNLERAWRGAGAPQPSPPEKTRGLNRLTPVAVFLAAALWFAGQVTLPASPAARQAAERADKLSALLKDVFAEVSDLGRVPGEEFVRREFFIGEGDDDTYKEAHAVILIQEGGGRHKMTVQVTRLVPDPDNPRIKHGRDPKITVCLVSAGRLVLDRSDYSEKELISILPELLKAIRGRKKLVRDRF
jgi:hypothetical protein